MNEMKKIIHSWISFILHKSVMMCHMILKERLNRCLINKWEKVNFQKGIIICHSRWKVEKCHSNLASKETQLVTQWRKESLLIWTKINWLNSIDPHQILVAANLQPQITSEQNPLKNLHLLTEVLKMMKGCTGHHQIF